MRQSGFSLIEVNMAIFVLAFGVLSMAALYPLGLRESMQSREDLKQSMFADFVLNVAVATASDPKVTRKQFDSSFNPSDLSTEVGSTAPDQGSHFVVVAVKNAVASYQGLSNNETHTLGLTYDFYCTKVEGTKNIMSFMIRSLAMDTSEMPDDQKRARLNAQPFYYAEALFQGVLDN